MSDGAGCRYTPRPTESRPRSLGARVAERRRLQVADGLCSVARHAAPGARRRRHELLLISRAAAVRPDLLEVAALVRWSTDPPPDSIVALHTLLTSGCDSPLYNPDVPAEDLAAALDRTRAALSARMDLTCSTRALKEAQHVNDPIPQPDRSDR
jgi:hypothetical protein